MVGICWWGEVGDDGVVEVAHLSVVLVVLVAEDRRASREARRGTCEVGGRI